MFEKWKSCSIVKVFYHQPYVIHYSDQISYNCNTQNIYMETLLFYYLKLLLLLNQVYQGNLEIKRLVGDNSNSNSDSDDNINNIITRRTWAHLLSVIMEQDLV